MKRFLVLFLSVIVAAAACEPGTGPIPAELDDSYAPVAVKSRVDAVQPSTGLVLWSENARDRHASYGKSISLEYAYCLPCKVEKTAAYITNTGIAPIYRDAFLAVGGTRSETSLKGLLPGDTTLVFIDKVSKGNDLAIVSDYILPGQKIQFDAEL